MANKFAKRVTGRLSGFSEALPMEQVDLRRELTRTTSMDRIKAMTSRSSTRAVSADRLARGAHEPRLYQAQKFDASMLIPTEVVRRESNEKPLALHLDDGWRMKASSVVIATDARRGGFNRSSQHLDEGGCDEHSKAAFGSIWSGAFVVTGSTAGGRTS